MKVSRVKRAENRAAIVRAGARLFRERGPGGVGVAEITETAGLTHGGFYGHFESKEALLAECIRNACHDSAQDLRDRPNATLAGYARAYLSHPHLTDPGSGCPVAALAVDAAREPPAVREALSEGVREIVDSIRHVAACDRREALGVLSTLVGALVIARSVQGVDDALAAEVLEAGRRAASRR